MLTKIFLMYLSVYLSYLLYVGKFVKKRKNLCSILFFFFVFGWYLVCVMPKFGNMHVKSHLRIHSCLNCMKIVMCFLPFVLMLHTFFCCFVDFLSMFAIHDCDFNFCLGFNTYLSVLPLFILVVLQMFTYHFWSKPTYVQNFIWYFFAFIIMFMVKIFHRECK